VVLSSRQVGAHALGYGERSLNELSRKLRRSDIPALIALLDDTNRSAAIGATFGLASQCGEARRAGICDGGGGIAKSEALRRRA
jgi:hypothetical protein